MKILQTLPDELFGFFIPTSAVVARLVFPEFGDFWLALVTAVSLFLIMHIRSQPSLKAAPKEKSSP